MLLSQVISILATNEVAWDNFLQCSRVRNQCDLRKAIVQGFQVQLGVIFSSKSLPRRPPSYSNMAKTKLANKISLSFKSPTPPLLQSSFYYDVHAYELYARTQMHLQGLSAFEIFFIFPDFPTSRLIFSVFSRSSLSSSPWNYICVCVYIYSPLKYTNKTTKKLKWSIIL